MLNMTTCSTKLLLKPSHSASEEANCPILFKDHTNIYLYVLEYTHVHVMDHVDSFFMISPEQKLKPCSPTL